MLRCDGAGEEASALLAAAGQDPACARLMDVFSQQPSCELPDGRTLTMLSSQAQWAAGQPLSMLLLSTAGPDVLLPVDSLAMLRQLLRGQLVVCAAALPSDAVAGMLALGARGVVCRADAASAAPTASLDTFCSYFAAFYDALLAGKPAAEALHAAEQLHPELTAAFQLSF